MFTKLLVHVVSVAACLLASSPAAAVGELIELLLTARTLDDQPIAPDGDGIVEIGVGEPFALEVSYNELRLFNDRLGAFALYTDLSLSAVDALEPILNETQRLIIAGEIRENTSGSLTFGLEGSSTTYVSDFTAFAADSRGEVVNALSAFGYTPDDYELTSLDFGNGDIAFQIHWVGEEFADRDLPDIWILGDFQIPVSTQTIEFAPRNPDGSINGDALRFNIDVFSRTFNDNEPFYMSQNTGGFDPAAGFLDVGGVGPIPSGGGGIPQLTDDGGFITPFDAFSVRVRFTQPLTGFVAGVHPGGAEDAVVLYGRGTPVPPSLVLLDEDSTLTFDVPEPQSLALQATGCFVVILLRRFRGGRRS